MSDDALHENEAKLRLTVEATGIGLWSWDPRARKAEWNERMHAITGSSAALSPDDYVARVVHPDDRERVISEQRQAAAGHAEFEAHRIVRPDGEVRWVLPFGYSHFDAKGRLTHVTGGMLDITRQRELEEHLRSAQKMEAIGALTAGVAHNFNNMLAVIIPAIELSLQGGGSRDLLAEAAHAARRAAGLVAQLMTFAGQRRGGAHGVVDIGAVIDRAVSMCERTFERQIRIVTAFDEGPLRVHGDAAGLEQVVVNALINARDALAGADRAEPRITVRARAIEGSEQGGEQVCVEIGDNGVGVSAAVKERLFEPFVTTKEPGQGTGLGLATSYAIVRDHGGAIALDSQPGAGTTLRIVLPRTVGGDSAQRASAPQQAQRARGRVMVVDDEVGIRTVVRDALEGEGHQVSLAADGHAALALLARGARPDLILFDRSMPGAPPARVLAEMRKLAPHVPVVFFTGEDVPEADRALVQGLLQKPVSLSELKKTVARFLAP